MPRKLQVYSRVAPYHITARVNNCEDFPGDLAYAWKVLTSELYLQTICQEILVHAFVVMPNHFHLLASFPVASVSKSIGEFLSSSTRIINTRCRRSGRMYGDRYHWTLIQEPLYYAHAFKYVYRNPVKGNLCLNVGNYPYSTYTGMVGQAQLPVALNAPLERLDRFVPDEFEKLDQWLNTPYKSEESESIKRALKKKAFAFPIDRKERKPLQIRL